MMSVKMLTGAQDKRKMRDNINRRKFVLLLLLLLRLSELPLCLSLLMVVEDELNFW